MRIRLSQLRQIIRETIEEEELDEKLDPVGKEDEDVTMETTFEVFISDTVRGISDLRKYKTRDRAEARYAELKRSHKPSRHSTVVLRQVGPDGNVQIYPEQILGR